MSLDDLLAPSHHRSIPNGLHGKEGTGRAARVSGAQPLPPQVAATLEPSSSWRPALGREIPSPPAVGLWVVIFWLKDGGVESAVGPGPARPQQSFSPAEL